MTFDATARDRARERGTRLPEQPVWRRTPSGAVGTSVGLIVLAAGLHHSRSSRSEARRFMRSVRAAASFTGTIKPFTSSATGSRHPGQSVVMMALPQDMASSKVLGRPSR